MLNHTHNFAPNSSRVELEVAGFTLVRESKWSFTYRKDKRSITFSKLLRDEFDWSILSRKNPESLGDEEKHDAAISIYVDNSNPKIPEAWREFAIKICG